MAEIDQIVEIFITRETTAIDTASFSIPLILATFDTTVFPERTRTYTDISEVGEDFDSTDSAYIIAQKLFSGEGIKPSTIVIGRKDSEETWTDALDAVEEDNSVWYALVADTHVPAEVIELATAIQARRKIYGTSTQDSNFTSGTHIGQQLSDMSLGRTFWVYTADADTQYPEAAWMSEQLPETPGSNTWNLKQAAGVTVSNISPTQRVNIRALNGNMYTTVAGVNVFQDGVMSDGEFIDVIIFIDWVHARMQEAIFFRLINSRKIPYTRAGATIIENEIRSVLSLGVTNGGIADAPAYTVTAPDPLNIPATMRAQRTMGDFLFEFRLAGAVHKVIVRGTAGI